MPRKRGDPPQGPRTRTGGALQGQILGDPDGLTLRERLFVEGFFRSAGNVTEAARSARFKNPDAQGWIYLRRPRIVAAIQRRLAAVMAAMAGEVSEDLVLTKILEHLHQGDRRVSLQAAQLLIRVKGYAAPTRHIRETVKGDAIPPYAQLVETLRGQTMAMSRDERLALAGLIKRDMVLAQEALGLLGEPGAAAARIVGLLPPPAGEPEDGPEGGH